jgi:hypothetical protein
MPRKWTTGNRALRHRAFDGINDFCLLYLKSNSSSQAVNDCRQFRDVFLSGIEICNIRYHFIGVSNSQLKKQSYWFVRARTLQDIDEKRKQLGDFSHITNIGKYVARVGLWFSATIPTGVSMLLFNMRVAPLYSTAVYDSLHKSGVSAEIPCFSGSISNSTNLSCCFYKYY